MSAPTQLMDFGPGELQHSQLSDNSLVLRSQTAGMLALAQLLTFALAFSLSLVDVAEAQRTRDRQIARTTARTAVFLFTENMLKQEVSQRVRVAKCCAISVH